ncbi:toll/interleukin-1 receptor domain-containing protein [Variovorax sp. J22R115]|uniref:toll/interleukin-1 receptor domain-containing protein n=1 Tax=Variovorax sp. J22R115 TaxID=3053509 RepID=UPI002578636D|nr:toll/interleukin-1 receptor domain-containing protein [Variovorax sp. J22R115]
MENAKYDLILPPPPLWNWKAFLVWFALGEALMVYAHLSQTPPLTLTPIIFLSNFVVGPVIVPLLYYGSFYLWRSYKYLRKVRKELRPPPTLDVFISHSSEDAQLAEILIEVLEAAVPDIAIRCSSIDKYRLDAGGNYEVQIRQEVLLSKVLLCLITPRSVKSDYVLFELGARWGVGLWTVPLLASGATVSLLPGPVSHLNAITCSSTYQIYQMIDKVVAVTKLHQNATERYEPYVARLQAAAANAKI